MKSTDQSTHKPSVAESDDVRLSAFGRLRRPPSQKELASVLQITTRHLRRWELAEAAANTACSRPYTHSDLWRLYRRRGRKGWDMGAATRLGLADVFERFERFGCDATESKDERSLIAVMMLRSLLAEQSESNGRMVFLPLAFGSGLAQAAKSTLGAIMHCPEARQVLVKAFFEASLIAEAKYVAGCETEPPAALSA